MSINKRAVVVGLSGGVDSAVSAALLLEQGYDVIGVSLGTWHAVDEGSSSSEQYQDAQNVAEYLGIPWILVDRQASFKEKVVGYYLNSLKDGQTPNPCILCNKILKWRSLLEAANGLGADFVATGHYARRHDSHPIELHKARDYKKDQSYFLAMLGQEELQRTLFPLGELTKEEVRKIAKTRKIPVADRKESQDLCFLGNLDQTDFIQHFAPEILRTGEIVHKDGRVLGEHSGLANYTEGQRKGIQVAFSEPLYVVEKDIQNNRLIVGEKEYLGKTSLITRDVNWISGKTPAKSINAVVKIRYRAAGQEAEILVRQDGKLNVQFNQLVRDITPGQALVMYQADNCLGMGFIE
jgi:tRNA-specific 2-thiouridylase